MTPAIAHFESHAPRQGVWGISMRIRTMKPSKSEHQEAEGLRHQPLRSTRRVSQRLLSGTLGNKNLYSERTQREDSTMKHLPRRIIYRVALVCLFTALFSGLLKADQFGDYTYTDNGLSIAITRFSYSGSFSNVDLTVPSAIAGKPVTEIGPGAFDGATRIAAIRIPSTVTQIGGEFFFPLNC
jgi:hypothetical protein